MLVVGGGGGGGGGTTLLEVINTSVETLQVTHGIGSNVSCAVGEFAITSSPIFKGDVVC